MGGTSAERYAVVSCLDDEVWTRFAALQRRRPGGFRIAALVRPADSGAGEDEETWVSRARKAAAHGPLGQHTHWTAPDHARPTTGGTGERVLEEAARLRELGLAPTLFCGGGWYTDGEVAEACATLGYADCTPRATRPPYLAEGGPWASLSEPARVSLPSGHSLLALPTTHSLGDLARALGRRSLPRYVHVYFHDTDLVSRRRTALVRALLPLLARRAQATDLDAIATEPGAAPPERSWHDVARL
jgi:hypothetical protein